MSENAKVLTKKSEVIHRGYIYSNYYWVHVFNLITHYDPYALRIWLLKQNYFSYMPLNGNCNSSQQLFLLQKTTPPTNHSQCLEIPYNSTTIFLVSQWSMWPFLISYNFLVYNTIVPSFGVPRGKTWINILKFLLNVFHTTLPRNPSFCFLDSDLKVLQTSAISKEELFNNPINLPQISLA